MLKQSVFLMSLVVTGCANDPIIDHRGVNEAAYQRDFAECQSYAREVDTVSETIKDGAIGAAVGGAVGAILGDGHDARRGAGVGAVAGGGKGLTKAEQRKERVLYRCLQGRGYKILG